MRCNDCGFVALGVAVPVGADDTSDAVGDRRSHGQLPLFRNAH
jgi:hypothetical protein